ncbi:MAG: enoyl-CoA hydratase [Microbacteriaceae bacterium]|nr:enoyl-CoA hydratase [Microbacteriaceae bacterium]
MVWEDRRVNLNELLGGDDEVLVDHVGSTGLLTLNRPKAINALTPRMVMLLTGQLEAWRNDDHVAAVVLDGAGERGLCAGGDIKAIQAFTDQENLDFLSGEYRLNAMIAEYPKPFIAIMDGFVMGGGVGVSAHASIRIVTERSRVGMPEVRIGLSPDVGGSYLLARAPGELGTHFALTADAMIGADAIVAGLADTWMLSDRLPDLRAGLRNGQDAISLVASLASAVPPAAVAAELGWIDRCDSLPTVELIVEALRAESAPAAGAAADAMLSASPLAVKATFAALRRARELRTLRECLSQELATMAGLHSEPDMSEGIRAQIIDKDRDPKWKPATLAEVTDEMVENVLDTSVPAI